MCSIENKNILTSITVPSTGININATEQDKKKISIANKAIKKAVNNIYYFV